MSDKTEIESPAMSPEPKKISVAKLSLGQNFAAMTPVKKMTTRLVIKRPGPTTFFMSSEKLWMETSLQELKETGEVYGVSSDLWVELE